MILMARPAFQGSLDRRVGVVPAEPNPVDTRPQKARNNAVRQLEAMGYRVTLDQAS